MEWIFVSNVVELELGVLCDGERWHDSVLGSENVRKLGECCGGKVRDANGDGLWRRRGWEG